MYDIVALCTVNVYDVVTPDESRDVYDIVGAECGVLVHLDEPHAGVITRDQTCRRAPGMRSTLRWRKHEPDAQVDI